MLYAATGSGWMPAKGHGLHWAHTSVTQSFTVIYCQVPVSLHRLLPLLLLIAPFLSGCGSSGNASSGVLRIWYGTDDPVESAWSQQLATRFHASHPQIQVRLSDFSFEDLNTKLQLALSAGNPPDLTYTTPRGPGIPAYVRANRLRNLTADARAYRWATSLRAGLLAQYNRPFSFYGAKRGSIMAVPSALAAVGILYNRQLLARLHLSVPRTLPAFERALAAARSAGLTAIGMGNADGWLGDDWYLTLVNALAPLGSLNAEQRLDPAFSFHRPVFLRAARILQAWSQAGYFTHDFGGIDAQEGIDQFFHGGTVFQLVSSSENPQIALDQRQTKIPLGIFPFPRMQGGTVMPVSGYEGWAVPAAAKNAGSAVAFISFLLSARTNRFLQNHNVMPTGAVRNSGTAMPQWQRQFLKALGNSQPGIYIDAAPVANLNATMEANVQLLLQGYEPPSFLMKSLQEVYASRGRHGSTARIDGEF